MTFNLNDYTYPENSIAPVLTEEHEDKWCSWSIERKIFNGGVMEEVTRYTNGLRIIKITRFDLENDDILVETVIVPGRDGAEAHITIEDYEKNIKISETLGKDGEIQEVTRTDHKTGSTVTKKYHVDGIIEHIEKNSNKTTTITYNEEHRMEIEQDQDGNIKDVHVTTLHAADYEHTTEEQALEELGVTVGAIAEFVLDVNTDEDDDNTDDNTNVNNTLPGDVTPPEDSVLNDDCMSY